MRPLCSNVPLTVPRTCRCLWRPRWPEVRDEGDSHLLPAELQACLARHLDLPAGSVSAHARRLREAGVLNHRGRGQSASRQGPGEAAVLLVALAGSLGPSDAASQVAAYAGTRLRRGSGKGVLHGIGLEDEGLDAVGAVRRVMESASDGRLDDALREAGIQPGYADAAFQATFVLDPPVRMQIRFSGYSGASGRESLDFATPDGAGRPRMWTMRTVEGSALVSLGRAFRP